MKKHILLIITFCIEIMIIISIAVANEMESLGFAIFYNIFYGIVLSTWIPIYLLNKKQEKLSSIGIKNLVLNNILSLPCLSCYLLEAS